MTTPLYGPTCCVKLAIKIFPTSVTVQPTEVLSSPARMLAIKARSHRAVRTRTAGPVVVILYMDFTIAANESQCPPRENWNRIILHQKSLENEGLHLQSTYLIVNPRQVRKIAIDPANPSLVSNLLMYQIMSLVGFRLPYSWLAITNNLECVA